MCATYVFLHSMTSYTHHAHMDNLTMYMLMFLHDTSLAECFITHDTGISTLSKCISLHLFRTQCCLKDLLQTSR